MADDTIHDQPSNVTPSKGKVSVKGPDSVDVQMTADAAIETSDRLLDAATRAKGLEMHDRQRERDREDQRR